MNQVNNQINTEPKEQELDLVELVRMMWLNRLFIIKVTICAMLCGLLIALLGSKSYTASCDVVPQSTSSLSSQLSSLAGLAGLNLGQNQEVKMLSPYVYENIVGSAKFCKELMLTKIYFEKAGEEMGFYDYYTNEEYNKPTFGSYVLKYTIGLPGLIMGAIKKETPTDDYSEGYGDMSQIETFTKEEYMVANRLRKSVTVLLDEDKGSVTISATMPEPLAAAQLAQATVDLLQKYITEFKIEKVKSNLDFIQQRHDELKKEFEDIQALRARSRDANHNTIRNSARIELERIDAEYQLAMSVYGEMAMQLEQAKIKVKETTPILTVIKPVVVPFEPSNASPIVVLFGFTFFGLLLGMVGVLFIPTFAYIVNSERMKGWIKELPKQ